MPKAKWMSDSDYAAFERCLSHLKNKKGVNRYAVCAASIKKSKKRNDGVWKKAMKRVGKKK